MDNDTNSSVPDQHQLVPQYREPEVRHAPMTSSFRERPTFIRTQMNPGEWFHVVAHGPLASDDSAPSAMDRLRHCLNHGIAVTVFVWPDELQDLIDYDKANRFVNHSARLGGSELIRPACYEPGWKERAYIRPTLGNQNPEAIQREQFQQWRENVISICARPHAIAYAHAGGLLWRITHELIGWGRTSQGISTATRRWAQGATGIEGWICERMDIDELQALYGALPSEDTKTLWPPWETFVENGCWTGTWTADNESWYRNRWEQLQQGKARTFTRRGWRDVLRGGAEVRREARRLRQEFFLGLSPTIPA